MVTLWRSTKGEAFCGQLSALRRPEGFTAAAAGMWPGLRQASPALDYYQVETEGKETESHFLFKRKKLRYLMKRWDGGGGKLREQRS